MTSTYPGAVDVLTNPTGGDQLSTSVGGAVHSAQHSNVNDAVEAIETTLGINPHGAYASVAARLAALAGMVPDVASGQYLPIFGANQSINNSDTPGNGVLRLGLVVNATSKTFTRIGCRIYTAASAGGVLRFGIWSEAGGKPGTLILDAGTVVATATGWTEITISQVLGAGVFWVGCVSQGAPATNPVLGWCRGIHQSVGTDDQFSPTSAWSATAITGALASTPTVSANNNAACVRLKAA